MFGRFAARSTETERLDRGEYTADEYGRWRKEMFFIHRIFGEVRALRQSLVKEIQTLPSSSVSVLDVAAGSGDLLSYLRDRTPHKDISVVGAECSAEATKWISSKGITAVRCDALQLPFAADSFDFVFCTLFLHHLNEIDAAELLRQMARVARLRFFVIDLDRRPLPYYAYKILGSVFLQPFSRDDGALSILRSYREDELKHLAERAGVRNVEVRHSAVNRLILSAAR